MSDAENHDTLPTGPPASATGGPHNGFGSLHLMKFWPDTPAA
jgi:hypothetical protein